MPKLVASELTVEQFGALKNSAGKNQARPTEMSSFLKCCINCLPGMNHPNPEVKGYPLVGFGRSALFISFQFLVGAVIHFAYLDAGCRQYTFDDDSLYDDGEKSTYYEEGWDGAGKPEDCTGKVIGLRPSSIVSVLATVGGLASAIAMPVAGAIVDATDKRHAFGLTSAVVLVVSNAAQIFINADTWLVMTIVQAIVCTSSFFSLALVVYAYLPELFTSEEESVAVTAHGRLYEQAGMLGMVVLTTAVTLGFGMGIVSTAVAGQIIAVCMGAPCLFVGFRLYKPRKANRQVCLCACSKCRVGNGTLHKTTEGGSFLFKYPYLFVLWRATLRTSRLCFACILP